MRKCLAPVLTTIVLIGLAGAMPVTWAKEPYRQVLISADLNMNPDPFRFGRQMIVSRYAVPECPITWSVGSTATPVGTQENVDVIWVDNGKLQIGVVATRGLGIRPVLMDQKPVLGWNSPVKDIVHPNFINLNSRGGTGWLEGFNEWFCRWWDGMERSTWHRPASSTTWVKRPRWN